MQHYSDVEFMSGQAFEGMPHGINLDFDRWRIGARVNPPTKQNAPKRATQPEHSFWSRRYDDRASSDRTSFYGCAFSRH